MRNIRLLLLLICCHICSTGQAYSISPIIVHLAPQGSGARQAVDIINDSNEPLAIEVTVRERIIDANGKDSLAVVNDKQNLFAIYPPQLLVKPKSTRSVQVQYIGDKNITKELAYKLIFEELNVNFDKPKNKGEQGGIDFLIKYQASLYVTPNKATPNVVIKSVKPLPKAATPSTSTAISNEIKAYATTTPAIITAAALAPAATTPTPAVPATAPTPATTSTPITDKNSVKQTKNKKQRLLITLENTGNAHQVINIPQIMHGNTMLLDEKKLINLIGSNILAKGIREYEIEVDDIEALKDKAAWRFNS